MLVAEEIYSRLPSTIVEASLDKHAEKGALPSVNCRVLEGYRV
jgi:hypothetical protein